MALKKIRAARSWKSCATRKNLTVLEMTKIDKKFWYSIIMTGFFSVLGVIVTSGGKEVPAWTIIPVSIAFGVACWWSMWLYELLLKKHRERGEKKRKDNKENIIALIGEKVAENNEKIDKLLNDLRIKDIERHLTNSADIIELRSLIRGLDKRIAELDN